MTLTRSSATELTARLRAGDLSAADLMAPARRRGVSGPQGPLNGLPALALSAGLGGAGLPIDIQMFGPRGADAATPGLRAARHAATQWPQVEPAM